MAAEFITVLSKSPLGITLDLDTSVWINKDVPGMVPVTRVVKGKLAPVTLKGTAFRQGVDAPPITIDGYVATQVPKDFWDAWLATHAEFGPLLDGYIKPAATMDAARRIGREREADRGMNPRLIEGDERVRNINGPGVTAPTVFDNKAA